MEVFALIISIVMYLSILTVLGFYVFFFFTKRYDYANQTLRLLFIHSLITIMILSWSLILMNGGFDVNFYLNIDYTWLLIPFGIFFIVINAIDALLQKKIQTQSSPVYIVGRFLLPGSIVIIMCACTIILYFSCHYLVYLSL